MSTGPERADGLIGWAGSTPPPRFIGTIGPDSAALADFVARGEEVLARLPPRAERTPAQQSVAAAVLDAGRVQRGLFLDQHVDAVYATLTDGLSVHRRLSDLVHTAAERFPGLVPSSTQLASERRVPQAAKDGREIDQGLFLSAVLGSAVAGRHLLDAMLLPSAAGIEAAAEFRRSDRIELGTVSVELRGRAAHVTLHNDHCLNAEDDRLARDLESAVDIVLLDDRVGVGVVRGGVMSHPRYRGRRVFSAGINLVDLRDGRISFVDFVMGRELGALNKLVHGILPAPATGAGTGRRVQKPWTAVVDSFAIGGGMQLLLTFDRVIAADDAYLSLPAAQEGIVPGLANHRLVRHVGARNARRIILSGRRVHATEPLAELICDEVLPTAELDGAIDRAVSELDNAAVVANRRMLNLTEEPFDLLRSYLAEFALVQAERLYSPDVLARLDARWARDGRENGGHAR